MTNPRKHRARVACAYVVCAVVGLGALGALSGCCYESQTYVHEATQGAKAKLKRGDASAFEAYTVDGVIVTPEARQFNTNFREDSREIRARLFAMEPASLFISKATLETNNGEYSVTAEINARFTVDHPLSGTSLYVERVKLFHAKPRADQGWAGVDWGAVEGQGEVRLHLYVGGTREAPAKKRLTFVLKLDEGWEIAWPT